MCAWSDRTGVCPSQGMCVSHGIPKKHHHLPTEQGAMETRCWDGNGRTWALISAQAAGGEREIVRARLLLHRRHQHPRERGLFDVLQSEQSRTLPVNQNVGEHLSRAPGETCLSAIQHAPLKTALQQPLEARMLPFANRKNNDTPNLSSQEGMIKGMYFGRRVGMDQIRTFAPSGTVCWVPHR